MASLKDQLDKATTEILIALGMSAIRLDLLEKILGMVNLKINLNLKKIRLMKKLLLFLKNIM
jgi:hypothetical protein